MSEKLPSFEHNLESMSVRFLRALILRDIVVVDDLRNAAPETMIDNGLLSTYVPSLGTDSHEENWYGYAVQMPWQRTGANRPHSLVLSKVDRRDYKRLEEDKELSIPYGVSPNDELSEIFQEFDREELQAIAHCLTHYIETGRELERHDDPQILSPIWSEHEAAGLMSLRGDMGNEQLGSQGEKFSLNSIAFQEAQRRFIENDGQRIDGKTSICLQLDLDGCYYLAELTGTISDTLEAIDITFINNGEPLDSMHILVDGVSGEPIVAEAPEMPILWNNLILEELLVDGRETETEIV